ncbi:MAG: universal stress protein [Geobacteraceae bacterium]|nr:universal stress protein [Geobacteraceae bacterium]
MFEPRRILVPTDLSEHSDRALRRAFDIARQFGAELLILHVVRDPVQFCTVDFCVSESLMKEVTAQMLDQARHAVRYQVARFLSMGDISLSTHITVGTPHEMILKEAEEKGVDLIVLSTHGATDLSRHLMGSVARHVLLGAGCQVLVVK